ncbi:hypothetical protein BDV59DRAFT_86889 [Aspergillus ambiguus]|uniref:uncharacterized protein n=1 Tax=Aspergillus ambiguus TaxID=176160 RepID=UPI003CCE1257
MGEKTTGGGEEEEVRRRSERRRADVQMDVVRKWMELEVMRRAEGFAIRTVRDRPFPVIRSAGTVTIRRVPYQIALQGRAHYWPRAHRSGQPAGDPAALIGPSGHGCPRVPLLIGCAFPEAADPLRRQPGVSLAVSTNDHMPADKNRRTEEPNRTSNQSSILFKSRKFIVTRREGHSNKTNRMIR